MRSILFHIFFIVTTFLYALVAVIFSLLPGRTMMMASLRRYTRLMVWGMRTIAGIHLSVTGHENVPKDGPVIFAAKHQSYGDGIALFSQFDDLSFVTGDHLERFLFLKRILAKMNAVVVSQCGGVDQRKKMNETSRIVREQGRRLLIYPEGHLSQVGTYHTYKRGIYHLYRDFNCPVVPVATNLGQRWNQTDLKKYPGNATLEMLQPIEPGLTKEDFMARLQDMIETRSIELLDMDNLGALNPDDIGKLSENDSARKARLAREARAADKAGAAS